VRGKTREREREREIGEKNMGSRELIKSEKAATENDRHKQTTQLLMPSHAKVIIVSNNFGRQNISVKFGQLR